MSATVNPSPTDLSSTPQSSPSSGCPKITARAATTSLRQAVPLPHDPPSTKSETCSELVVCANNCRRCSATTLNAGRSSSSSSRDHRHGLRPLLLFPQNMFFWSNTLREVCRRYFSLITCGEPADPLRDKPSTLLVLPAAALLLWPAKCYAFYIYQVRMGVPHADGWCCGAASCVCAVGCPVMVMMMRLIWFPTPVVLP